MNDKEKILRLKQEIDLIEWRLLVKDLNTPDIFDEIELLNTKLQDCYSIINDKDKELLLLRESIKKWWLACRNDGIDCCGECDCSCGEYNKFNTLDDVPEFVKLTVKENDIL